MTSSIAIVVLMFAGFVTLFGADCLFWMVRLRAGKSRMKKHATETNPNQTEGRSGMPRYKIDTEYKVFLTTYVAAEDEEEALDIATALEMVHARQIRETSFQPNGNIDIMGGCFNTSIKEVGRDG